MSSSSNVAIVMAILLLLEMHACMARNYPSHFQSVNKLQDVDNTKSVHETDINGFPVFEDAKEMPSEDVTIGTLDKNVAPVTTGMQHNIEAKPRTMLETNEAKEATGVNEGEPLDEDTTVEDYVQIHRKSPIHNHH